MSHLLVTNDFPPKLGGIQSYLWELWRRLPAGRSAILTTAHAGAAAFDAVQPMPVTRARHKVLLPTPSLVAQVNQAAERVGASLVVLDPALPVGLIGPHLRVPYAVVLHGAEVTVPRRLPLTRPLLKRVLGSAELLIAAGAYPAAEARRVCGPDGPPVVEVPPGVDTDRFVPLAPDDKERWRTKLGLPGGPLVVSVSRLVPRKGMDVLIEATSRLARTRPGLTLAIAGGGRDRDRLERLVNRFDAPVRFLGRVGDDDLPGLYGCGDVFAMVCRNRWAGLEQEGFGIVFMEAAACAVPQVAGDSGGAADAVADGETGVVVRRPTDPAAVALALAGLIDRPEHVRRQGELARRRAVAEFSYDTLAARLDAALLEAEGASSR